MTRKIALGITLVTTVLLMLIHLNVIALPFAFVIGGLTLKSAELLPYVVTAVIAVIAILCYSRRAALSRPKKAWSSVIGWFATFTGVIMSLLFAYEIFCKIAFPSTPVADNTFDTATSWLMLLFGLAAGVMLVMQGFDWMSFAKHPSTAVQWLSVTPAVWMWFRLARYEISFASTVDISENFFVLATLVFGSLFFLQLARMIAGIGKAPKNSLLIFALITAMVGLAQAPASILFMPDDQPLSNLLIVVADAVIAAFALIVAILQIFCPADEEPASDEQQKPVVPAKTEQEETDDADEDLTVIPGADTVPVDDTLAWTEPPRQTEPAEPPFEIDSVLPIAKAPDEPTAKQKLSVDDLLDEIDSL